MILHQAYRFALDPSAVQVRALMSHAGASRMAFNWALGFVNPGSCTFTTGTIRVEADRRHVTLPRLGTIRLHESARKLARRLDGGAARIMSATVKRDGGRWFVSFACEVDKVVGIPARPDAVVGVDLGVSALAVLSTGETVANPKHLEAARRQLRRAARRLARRVGPDKRTKQRPSNRWLLARADLARAHARVANLRRDGLHKLTLRLASTYGTVVVEDLHVAGMIRSRRLGKAIADCGFATIRQQLSYKTAWRGGRLVVADRWLPSSKTCSGCGAVKAKLPLRVRTFTCTECGIVLDRDLNAARNLAQLVSVTGTGVAGDPQPQGSNGRGADRKTRPGGRAAVKRPPGTAPAGQTGTVPPQGGTSDQALARAH